MNLADLAAQLIMIDLPASTLSEVCQQHLREHPWGGILLFARNLENRRQALSLMEEVEKLSPGLPPLMAVDQEGGLVDRIRFPDTVLTPGLMALAASGDPEVTRRAHFIMGQQLHEMGFHIDFAPCVDINSNADNPVIGVRSCGEDPSEVARHAQAACLGLRQGGVAATAKHFPGHGDCSLDSHVALPTLPHSMERLQTVELVPFQSCIEGGVEAMMTAHITFPALDPRPGRAATLSQPIVDGLLRQAMNYQGVIFSDSLEMQAIADHYGSGEATVLAVEAGCDMVICCGGPEQHRQALEALVEAVQGGRLERSRLEQSWQRLQLLRKGLPPMQRCAENRHLEAQKAEMKQLVERTITLVRNQDNLLPLQDKKVLLLSPDLLPLTPLGEMARSDSVLQHLQLDGVELSEAHYPAETRGPALEHLLNQARSAEVVLFTVYARHRLPDATRELGQALLQANPKTLLISLSSPYVLRDLPEMPAFLCSYNYTPLSLEALGRVLTGHLQPQGRLTVSIPGLYSRGQGLSYAATAVGG